MASGKFKYADVIHPAPQKKKKIINYGQVLGKASFRYNLYKILLILLLLRLLPGRLLILYLNLPRLRFLLLCQTVVRFVSTTNQTKLPMPYAFIHIPLHFIQIPPSELFSRSLGFYLFNLIFRFPTRQISIRKKVPYRSIHPLRYRFGRSAFFLFFFPFFFFTHK